MTDPCEQLDFVDVILDDWIQSTQQPRLEYIQPMLLDYVANDKNISIESIQTSVVIKKEWEKDQPKPLPEFVSTVSNYYEDRNTLIEGLHTAYKFVKRGSLDYKKSLFQLHKKVSYWKSKDDFARKILKAAGKKSYPIGKREIKKKIHEATEKTRKHDTFLTQHRKELLKETKNEIYIRESAKVEERLADLVNLYQKRDVVRDGVSEKKPCTKNNIKDILHRKKSKDHTIFSRYL